MKEPVVLLYRHILDAKGAGEGGDICGWGGVLKSSSGLVSSCDEEEGEEEAESDEGEWDF